MNARIARLRKEIEYFAANASWHNGRGDYHAAERQVFLRDALTEYAAMLKERVRESKTEE
jgi:hypothetical protein